MDAVMALDTACLRAYWPFFVAKRELDTMQFIADSRDGERICEPVSFVT